MGTVLEPFQNVFILGVIQFISITLLYLPILKNRKIIDKLELKLISNKYLFRIIQVLYLLSLVSVFINVFYTINDYLALIYLSVLILFLYINIKHIK